MRVLSAEPRSGPTSWRACCQCASSGRTGITMRQSLSEVSWVREHASAIRSDDPDDEDWSDLECIADLVGDSRVIGLGESTHGTQEEARMKHRLFRFLVEELGFTTLGIERDVSVVGAVDNLLGPVKTPLSNLPAGMYPWRSIELLELLQWIRARNGSRSERIRFVGFDMQQELDAGSVDVVRRFLAESDPMYAASVGPVMEALEEVIAAGIADTVSSVSAPGLLRASAEISRRVAEMDSLQRTEGSWVAALNASVILQSLQLRALPPPTLEDLRAVKHRDRCMAENVRWILDRLGKESKLVLWAHNFHVARIPEFMGGVLDDLIDSYKAIGFAFHEGSFRVRLDARDGRGMSAPQVVEAIPSFEGSFEWLCHEAGLKRAVIRLSDGREHPVAREWRMREVGHAVTAGRSVDEEFASYRVADIFDALVFFDSTNALDLLPLPS